MDRIFTAFATKVSTTAGQPQVFVLALLVIVGWAVGGPVFGFSDTWQLVMNTGSGLVTFLMVFIIQNGQNRDAAAMQAKLDELVRAMEQAREEFIGIEHLPDKQISGIRRQLEDEVGCEPGKAGTADDSVERLLERYK